MRVAVWGAGAIGTMCETMHRQTTRGAAGDRNPIGTPGPTPLAGS